VIVRYIDDFDATPRGLLLALDHSTFIGILTNAILGLRLVATAARRVIWARADQLVFWGLGLMGFVIGLISETAVIKRVSTPIMGASILLALLTAAIRLSARRPVTEPEPALSS